MNIKLVKLVVSVEMKKMIYEVRTLMCSECLIIIDRDINLAINIYNKLEKTIKQKTKKVEKT